MKYFARILIVLVLAVAVICGVYYHTNGLPTQEQSNGLTTASKPPATERRVTRELLASLDKEGFSLYRSDNGVVLVHGEREFTFDNWSRMIGEAPVELSYLNIDEDKEKELVVRAAGAQDENGEYAYELYILNPTTDADGNEDYEVVYASRDTWASLVDSIVKAELRQLGSSRKIVQLAMVAGLSNSINYNAAGIAQNGYAGYFKSLQNAEGKYMTVDKWTRGNGNYYIRDKKIIVEFAVNVAYKDSKASQQAGVVRFGLTLGKDNRFSITQKSMVFEAAKAYRVTDPRNVSPEPWQYTENNTDKTPPEGDMVIDWLTYSPAFDISVLSQAQNFGDKTSDIRSITTVTVTDAYVELTAKSGCSFDAIAAKKREFSVVINQGEDSELDIADTAVITTTGDAEVLRITLDKSYPQSEIKTITINFGVK